MEESTRAHPAGAEGQSIKAGSPSPTPSGATRQTDENYEQSKRSGADSYAQARQTIGNAGYQAQRAATDWMQQTRAETDAYVHEKPWTAIGVAAGIGFLIGVILRR